MSIEHFVPQRFDPSMPGIEHIVSGYAQSLAEVTQLRPEEAERNLFQQMVGGVSTPSGSPEEHSKSSRDLNLYPALTRDEESERRIEREYYTGFNIVKLNLGEKLIASVRPRKDT